MESPKHATKKSASKRSMETKKKAALASVGGEEEGERRNDDHMRYTSLSFKKSKVKTQKKRKPCVNIEKNTQTHV